MGDFKVGDRVDAVDDVISGYVLDITGNRVVVETEDGFPMTFDKRELVKCPEDISVSSAEVERVKREKETPKRKRSVGLKPKERQAPKMEVDLHIHQLVRNHANMAKHDILNLQLDTAKRQLDFAIAKKIQKVVFIHGVGEGVLREELHYLFRRYENVDYYDADYQKYGVGATEVYIRQQA